MHNDIALYVDASKRAEALEVNFNDDFHNIIFELHSAVIFIAFSTCAALFITCLLEARIPVLSMASMYDFSAFKYQYIW